MRFFSHLIIFFFLMCALSVAIFGEESAKTASEEYPIREWEEAKGGRSITARLSEMKATAVVLQKEDGTIVEVALTKLSKRDREYVKVLRAPRPAAKGAKGVVLGEEILFREHNLKFTIPTGWNVVEHREQKGNEWCVLQQGGAGDIKTTVAIWAGPRFIADAPESRAIRGGNVVAAGLWAQKKAMSWALGTPDKPPPATKPDWVSTAGKFGGAAYIGSESKTDEVAGYGLSTAERRGGPLTVGCAAKPEAMKDAMFQLEAIIGPKQ